jgi:hypothetical protein
MKKLIILALMALLVTGAFAEITFSGFVEYETASSLDSGEVDATTKDYANYGRYDGDVRLIANIKADDYNTGVIRIRSRTAVNSVIVDNAHATTDLGKFFSLPVGWKSSIGLNEWAFQPVGNLKWDTLHRIVQRNVYSVSARNGVVLDGSGATSSEAADYELQSGEVWVIQPRAAGVGGGYADYYFDSKIWGIKESFLFQDVFTLNAFFSLNGSSVSSAGYGTTGDAGYSKLRDFYIDGVFSQAAGPGKLGVELAYMLWTSGQSGYVVQNWDDHEKELGFGDGTVLFAVGYTGVPLTGDLSLDAGAAYYLPLSKASPQAWGVNAQLNVGKFAYVLIGAQGYPDAKEDSDWYGDNKEELGKYKGEMLHNIRVAGGVTPIEFLSLDAGVLFYMGDDESALFDKDVPGTATKRSTLNTFDISAALKVGKAEYRLGYLYVPTNDISIDPFNGGDNNIEAIQKSLYFKARVAF